MHKKLSKQSFFKGHILKSLIFLNFGSVLSIFLAIIGLQIFQRFYHSNPENTTPPFPEALITALNKQLPIEDILIAIKNTSSLNQYIQYYQFNENRDLLETNGSPMTWTRLQSLIPTDLSQISSSPMTLERSFFSPASLQIFRSSSGKKSYILTIPGSNPNPESLILPILLLCMLLSNTTSLGLSYWILIKTMHTKASSAEKVFSDLSQGHLDARIPIFNNDEFGELMSKFNQMANELQKAMEKIKFSEQLRAQLWEEISHDLGTPLTSLTSLVELLSDKHEKLSSSEIREFLSSCSSEVNYISRLVNDQLFLSRIDENNFTPKEVKFHFSSLIAQEVNHFKNQQMDSHPTKTISFHNRADAWMLGEPLLIQRLIRNLLNNSWSFCRTKLTLEFFENEEKQLVLSINDDGPGFPEKEIAHYGQKRPSRLIHEQINGRISLGLGSVIIKRIADIYHAKIEIKNIMDTEENAGRILGANIRLIFPHQAMPS